VRPFKFTTFKVCRVKGRSGPFRGTVSPKTRYRFSGGVRGLPLNFFYGVLPPPGGGTPPGVNPG